MENTRNIAVFNVYALKVRERMMSEKSRLRH